MDRIGDEHVKQNKPNSELLHIVSHMQNLDP
jgi:hypothetical protein